VGGAYFFAISHWPLAISYSLVALKHIVQHQKQDWKVALERGSVYSQPIRL
jgi:hypothetical protein